MASNLEKLVDVLGFDPVKNRPDNAVMQEALKEIKEERVKELKANAKTLLVEAMNLAKEKAKSDREYEEKSKKFDKTFGKLMGRINAMASGVEPPKEEDKEESNGE